MEPITLGIVALAIYLIAKSKPAAAKSAGTLGGAAGTSVASPQPNPPAYSGMTTSGIRFSSPSPITTEQNGALAFNPTTKSLTPVSGGVQMNSFAKVLSRMGALPVTPQAVTPSVRVSSPSPAGASPAENTGATMGATLLPSSVRQQFSRRPLELY